MSKKQQQVWHPYRGYDYSWSFHQYLLHCAQFCLPEIWSAQGPKHYTEWRHKEKQWSRSFPRRERGASPCKVTDKRDYYWSVYLKSDHWHQLRHKMLVRYPYCQLCGKTEGLDVHHKGYHNLYDITPRDLVVLCRHHHGMVHDGTHGLHGKLLEAQINQNLKKLFRHIRDEAIREDTKRTTTQRTGGMI